MLLPEALEVKHDSYYEGVSGSFRMVHTSSWDSCRVTFHENWDNNASPKDFYYLPRNRQTQQIVIDNIIEVETRLTLPEKYQTKLWKTNKQAIICEPGKWWLDPIRFHFLTAVCRDAHESGIESARRIGDYLKSTSAAVFRFLQGNVFYQGLTFEGWVEMFGGGDNGELLGSKPAPHSEVKVRHHHYWNYKALLLHREVFNQTP